MQRKSQTSRQMRDLDFSQDALGLIQEKKKDIEKVESNKSSLHRHSVFIQSPLVTDPRVCFSGLQERL